MHFQVSTTAELGQLWRRLSLRGRDTVDVNVALPGACGQGWGTQKRVMPKERQRRGAGGLPDQSSIHQQGGVGPECPLCHPYLDYLTWISLLVSEFDFLTFLQVQLLFLPVLPLPSSGRLGVESRAAMGLPNLPLRPRLGLCTSAGVLPLQAGGSSTRVLGNPRGHLLTTARLNLGWGVGGSLLADF